MRKSTNPKARLQGRNSLTLLTRKLEVLEKRLEQLEARVPFLDASSLTPFGGGEETIGRLGRKPRISRMELFGRRERLANYCSFNWPELTWILGNAKDASSAALLIQKHLQPGISNEHEHLCKNAEPLWAFVKSNRYHGDPRHIANAMAGVPIISWRTSWNRCSNDPTTLGLHLRAHRDYLRRKFPERLRELLQASSREEIIAVLNRARTDDEVIRWLHAYPEHVPKVLEEGKPKHELAFNAP